MKNTEAPHTELRADVLAYCEAHGMTKTAFGVKAVGDPRFVADLEKGREPRWSTIERVRLFMRGAA
jgi:hypothetical protein